MARKYPDLSDSDDANYGMTFGHKTVSKREFKRLRESELRITGRWKAGRQRGPQQRSFK